MTTHRQGDGPCAGRTHRDHATVTCNGSCCTSCGGPIDENEECRCESENARLDAYSLAASEPFEARWGKK